MGAGEHQTKARDWVLERILAFCQDLGLVCDGHEEELMVLFTAIEANRNNRKEGNGNKRGDKVGNHGNRELKQLALRLTDAGFASRMGSRWIIFSFIAK